MTAIGARIRRVRKRQGRTLQEVADACGFTRSLLSQIETGKTMPPIATLTRIGEALGVPISALLSDDVQASTQHTPRERIRAADFVTTNKGYRFFALAASRPEKLMQPLLFEARRGEVTPGPLRHTGEEFVYVLEGEMRYRVGPVDYHLREGDSLYFDAEQDHDLTPITERVFYLAVFCDVPIRPQVDPSDDPSLKGT